MTPNIGSTPRDRRVESVGTALSTPAGWQILHKEGKERGAQSAASLMPRSIVSS